jgi:hypothetical protein
MLLGGVPQHLIQGDLLSFFLGAQRLTLCFDCLAILVGRHVLDGDLLDLELTAPTYSRRAMATAIAG